VGGDLKRYLVHIGRKDKLHWKENIGTWCAYQDICITLSLEIPEDLSERGADSNP
jgi:hypothetical protein